MCRLRNIAMRNYLESVTTKQTHTHRRMDRQTDAGQSDPYVPLCFAGDTKMVINLHTYLIKQLLYPGNHGMLLTFARSFKNSINSLVATSS